MTPAGPRTQSATAGIGNRQRDGPADVLRHAHSCTHPTGTDPHSDAPAPVRHRRHAPGDGDPEHLPVELRADLREVGVVPEGYAPLEMT